MHLRSRGPSPNRQVDDLSRLERDIRRTRNQRRQQQLLQRLEINQTQPQQEVMDNHDEANPAPAQNQNNGPAPVQNQRPPRFIGAHDEPQIHGHRTGIQPPPINNNNFKIKASLISMVQGNKFHGLPMEDPLDHLDQFDMLCSTVKINGISEDAFKLRLFPFSLGDKAHIWQKNLPPNTITTWDSCKRLFLSKFFSTTRTARLRNEISSFSQKGTESFSESWERFKGYTSQCPHHGFSRESLLSTLYRGVLPKIRMLLDTASNGNFLGQEATQGMQLVENLATSDGNYGEDYDRQPRDHVDRDDNHRREMKALNDKLDKVLQATLRPINFVGDQDYNQESGVELCPDDEQEVNYVGGQGFNNGYNPNYKNNNLSYRSNNVENPQDQVYPPLKQPQQNAQGNYAPKPQGQYATGYQPGANYQPRYQHNNQQYYPQAPKADDTSTLLKQLLEGQSKHTTELNQRMKEINTKVDSMYNDLNSKFERLSSQV